MMISASQGANSTGSAAIAKLCATCARGIRRPPISNSKVTSAECPNFGAIMPNTHNELYLRALQYCSEHDSKLDMEKSFGFGVHGSVFACLRATSNVKTALKIHERSKPYFRERDVYLRLRELEITELDGHNVPALLEFDDNLLAIEMSVVVRPFLLDFGGAYLDQPPDYDDDILDQWELDKQEQFEENWPKASRILSRLRSYGIYVADVDPTRYRRRASKLHCAHVLGCQRNT